MNLFLKDVGRLVGFMSLGLVMSFGLTLGIPWLIYAAITYFYPLLLTGFGCVFAWMIWERLGQYQSR